MRTFIALEFNRNLKDRLGRIQRVLKENAQRGRWVYFDNFHLTLKFLGNIDVSQINEIKSVLGDIARTNKKIRLSLDDLGFFPGKDIIRVVWLGIKGDIKNLEQLHREVDFKINELGFSREKRKFTPHITLGRDVVFNTTMFNLNEKIYEDLKYDFTLDTIAFIKSEEINGKRVYTPLKKFELR